MTTAQSDDEIASLTMHWLTNGLTHRAKSYLVPNRCNGWSAPSRCISPKPPLLVVVVYLECITKLVKEPVHKLGETLTVGLRQVHMRVMAFVTQE